MKKQSKDFMKDFIGQVFEATALGDEIKKVIPPTVDTDTLVIALSYLASDIAKDSPDFTKRKQEILEQIEACFGLWGDC